MHLKELSILNFKNYQQADLKLSPKINCLVGDNGVGKTNVLDAIHYLSLCKSFFNPIDSHNINNEEDFLVLQGEFERDEKAEKVYCGVKRNKKKVFKRNNKEYEKLADHIGLFPVVMISPADSALISEGSEGRRKFINGVISQYDKEYLNNIISYNKALSQRNALLKDFARRNYFDLETLEIWNEQMVRFGESIFTKRVEFIEKLTPVFQHYYEFVSQGKEKVKLEYKSDLADTNFYDLLKDCISKDRQVQYSTAGIHKDDLILSLNGYPIKKNGSQGQQKTYLVALKLAKFDFIKDVNGHKPLLLLDDIFDKFDTSRVRQIVQLVSDESFGQIFITDTNKEHLDKILEDIQVPNKIFTIKDGEVIQENEKE